MSKFTDICEARALLEVLKFVILDEETKIADHYDAISLIRKIERSKLFLEKMSINETDPANPFKG